MNTQTQTQKDIAAFSEEQVSWLNDEPYTDLQERKIVSSQEYEEDGQSIIKEIYEDGSWSESCILRGRGFYNEYYANNNKKFEYSWAEGDYRSYTIYDEDGKILYWEYADTTCPNGEDEYDKYDKKGRLIEDLYWKYIYDDEKNTKTRIIKPPLGSKKCKIVTVYDITDGKETILSNTFVWETWIEIDLINWWIEKLIKDRDLKDVPYIDYYEGMWWE